MIRGCNWAATRSRWFLPAFCLLLGGVVMLAGWLGGQLALGLAGFAIMACLGLFVAVAGGSETIRGLRGDGRDERFAQIDLRATAITGLVLIVAVITGWLVEIARGPPATRPRPGRLPPAGSGPVAHRLTSIGPVGHRANNWRPGMMPLGKWR